MNFRYKFIISITMAVMFKLCLIGCVQQPPPPLRVGVNLWPGYETLYLARSLGYYDNTPIRLVDYPSGTEQARAFRNGEIEAAGLSIDQILLLAATRPDIRIVTVMDFSDGGDVILGKPEVRRLQDLKGKKIGVESTALGAYVIARALQQVGMSTKDVQIVSIEASEHERAFKNEKVDAVVTFGPARTNLLAAGARLLFDSSEIPGEIVDCLIVRQDVLNSQLEALQVLVKGIFRAFDYLKKNPLDAARRIAPRTGITAKQFLESLGGLRLPDIEENQRLLGQTDASLVMAMRQISQVMLENRLLSIAVDPEPLLENRLVKNIKS